MKLFSLLTMLAIVLSINFSYGQNIQGIVYDLSNSMPVSNVVIKNLRTNDQAASDKDGNFKIPAELNDYLTFAAPGFLMDTVFHFEEGIRRVYLLRDEKVLQIDEVIVRRLTDSRLAIEINKAKNEGKSIDISQLRGGIRVSPTRVFGKKAKIARSNLELLMEERDQRYVDRRFNSKLINGIILLNEKDIALFKERFRPTKEFLEKSSGEELKLYILDSYKKFKSAP